jgi:hypothetical protein
MPTRSRGSASIWGDCLSWIVKSFVTPMIVTPGRPPHYRPGPWSRPGTTVYVCGWDVVCVVDECAQTAKPEPDPPVRERIPVVASRVLL